jgi:hypothetical protein
LIAASLVSFEIASSERPLSRSICRRSATTMLACRASVWLASRTRCGAALLWYRLSVARQLLGCEKFLRHRLQIVALLLYKAWTLHYEERLAGADPVAACDRRTGHDAGDGTAHDPQLWRRDHDLGMIGGSCRLGSQRDANAEVVAC